MFIDLTGSFSTLLKECNDQAFHVKLHLQICCDESFTYGKFAGYYYDDQYRVSTSLVVTLFKKSRSLFTSVRTSFKISTVFCFCQDTRNKLCNDTTHAENISQNVSARPYIMFLHIL